MIELIENLILLLNKNDLFKYIFYIISILCIIKIIYIDIYKNTFLKLLSINKALFDFREFIYKSLDNISNKINDIEKDIKILLNKKNKSK